MVRAARPSAPRAPRALRKVSVKDHEITARLDEAVRDNVIRSWGTKPDGYAVELPIVGTLTFRHAETVAFLYGLAVTQLAASTLFDRSSLEVRQAISEAERDLRQK